MCIIKGLNFYDEVILTLILFLVTFIPSRAGRRLLKVGKFTFWKKTVSSTNKIWWRCSSYNTTRCIATVATRFDRVVAYKNHHNHLPPEYYRNQEGHYIKYNSRAFQHSIFEPDIKHDRF